MSKIVSSKSMWIRSSFIVFLENLEFSWNYENYPMLISLARSVCN
jgi:hypothetical protein